MMLTCWLQKEVLPFDGTHWLSLHFIVGSDTVGEKKWNEGRKKNIIFNEQRAHPKSLPWEILITYSFAKCVNIDNMLVAGTVYIDVYVFMQSNNEVFLSLEL